MNSDASHDGALRARQLLSESTQRMSTATVFVISVLLCLVQVHSQVLVIEKELQRSALAEQAVRRAIDEKLPPTAEARESGAIVLETLTEALRLCDDQLRANKSVAQYANCVGSNQGLAMASLGELAGQHWAKSGASRPTLFW